MNESPDLYEEASDVPLTRNKAEGQSPGEMLREARLAHDYSIEDLCAQTKLSPKSIRALEDNNFDVLSQPVFARGYYRQCAKVLDIDSDRLMAAYAAWGGEAAPRPASPTALHVVPEDVTPQSRRALGVILGALILLIAIGAGFWLLADGSASDDAQTGDNPIIFSDDQNSAASDGEADRDAAANTAAPADSDTNQSTAGGEPADSVPPPTAQSAPEQGRPIGGRNVNDTLRLDSGEQSQSVGSSGDTEAPAAQTPPPIPPNRLDLNFSNRSWVEVRDADGVRLLNGIIEGGETRRFERPAPYRITLGRAQAVDVSIGGEAVNVDAQTRSNGTARLNVEARDDG